MLLRTTSLSTTDDKTFRVADAKGHLRDWLARVYHGVTLYFPVPEETTIQQTRIVEAWKVFDGTRRPLEARFTQVFSLVLARAGKTLAANLVSTLGSYNTGLLDQVFRAELTLAYNQCHFETAKVFLALAGNRVSVRKAEFDLVDPADYPEMQRYFRLVTAQKVANVLQSTKQMISTVIENGFRDGSSIPDIAKRLEDSFGFSKQRAERIARTEVIQASNASTFFGVGANVNQNGLLKDWISTGDKRTRETHRQAGATQKDVPYGDFFEVGGFPMAFPGDSSQGAPAREIVNCFPADTAVQFGELHGASKRWYKGPMVSIKTSIGDKLSGTSNHPILTKRGWVPLKGIQVGDELVCGLFREHPRTGGPYVKHTVPTVGQVFSSLDQEGVLNRVPGASLDFHGDGSNADINIVSANSFLMGTIQASSLEPRKEQTLTDSNMGFSVLTGSRFFSESSFSVSGASSSEVRRGYKEGTLSGGKLSHPEAVSITDSSPSHSSVLQNYNYSLVAHSEDFGDFLKRGAFPIALADGGVSNIVLEFRSPGMDSSQLENFENGAYADTEFAGYLVHRELAEFVPVTNVSVEDFSGDVFNLHTEIGYYTANRIIVANCRCAVAFTAPRITF